MTHLLLIRHAQSKNNANPESLRTPDPGLTELGIQQAECVAKWLQQTEVTRLYSSPFLRALLTAEPIAKQLGLPVTIRADIFEQGGCYQGHVPGEEIGQPGMSKSQIRDRFPGWHVDESITEKGWWASRPYESFDQAQLRARSVMQWLKREVAAEPGCHALVTHGDFKHLLVSELLAQSQSNQKLGAIHNTSISKFVFTDGNWELDWYNSAHHLPVHLLTL